MRPTGSHILRGILLASSCLVASPIVLATGAQAGGPTGGKVVVGSATVTTPTSTSTVITQSSNKALINWNSFSLSADSSVTFDQPNSKSITVNRVTGNAASAIYGDLYANGRIWLINGNGILFGKGSQINVGALIATTSDITDQDFRKGQYRFSVPSTSSTASVVNQGTIHAASGGSVVLSAPRVSNEGIIQADLGTVVLGGADAFTVDTKGDNLIRYQVTQAVSKTPTNADGSPAAALVSNSGTIMAAGGKVLMTARAARSVEDSVINNSGIVEATSVSAHDGEIDLDAGDGTVTDSGTLDASGKAAGQTGGAVNVTGGTVNIADGAKIDASGDAGGGSVMIGGDFHGKGALADATQTNIGNATITADAITKGNGGKVAVWSNANTTFSGTISAKGGAKGGDGGYVETSGGNLQIGLNALVNTSAANGKSGTWLLDPDNIVVANGGTTPLTGGTLGLGTDPDSTDTIAPSTIVNALESGTDVLLEAGNSITVEDAILYSSSNALTMLAEGNITVEADIQNSQAT
ncbi:MAG TPA: filamentous hemagglutinin N-terminal domain-containing protein, partial [Rhizomicrobium sp.]|nr:filamentous hemagglutinin N-terminal domain-containing protein [Rhizomicrobium sp.]